VVRRIDAITLKLEQLLASRRKVGTVTGTSGTKVVVVVDGASMTLPRLASYTTPAVNDVVIIDAMVSGAWIVLGKPA
jgi:hypothetical protein